MKPYLFAYVYAMAGVFAIVLAVCAYIGQIPNYLIYSSAALAVNAAVLGLATQDYRHD